MTPDEQSAKLLNIFLPYSAGCRKRVVDGGVRFVHYTSAANALSIIRHRRLWMRNTTCMADYREVHHGLDALNWYFNNEPHRQAFFAALNDCHLGSAEDIWTLFNHWWQNTQLQTYITSIAEHDDREDLHGRLSMWRAFGGAAAARVAFVIKLQLGGGSRLGRGRARARVRALWGLSGWRGNETEVLSFPSLKRRI